MTTMPAGARTYRDPDHTHRRSVQLDGGEHGTIYGYHPDPGDDQPCSSPWCQWVEAHGLHADEISTAEPLVCDDLARTITYRKGRPLYRPTDGPELGADESWVSGPLPPIGNRMVCRQLESPAAPFPGGDPA